MSKRTVAALIGVAAVAAAGAVAFLLLRGTRGESVAQRSGRTLAAALAGALEEADEIASPHRCARLDAESESMPAAIRARVEARGMTVDGYTLRLPTPKRGATRLVLGVVADARGVRPGVVDERLARLRRHLEASGVQVLLSLGGMGTSEEEITAALRPLAVGATWPVIAIPGDRENLPAHRAAVAALNQEAETLVLDGSAIRLLVADSAVVGTLPGSAHAARLLAGIEGCQHTDDDALALAELLLEQDLPRVWATHAPPRQPGPGASDVALGGVHVGESELVEAIDASKASLVLHALVDEAAARQRPGALRLPPARAKHLASGALDAVPIHVPDHGTITGAALVIRIGAREIRWTPILFEGERLRYPLR